MDRTEAELAQIAEWRKEHHLMAEGITWKDTAQFQRAEPKNIHFFNYDPTLGPTDLSNVSVKRDTNRDSAIFSIPKSFTESARSKFVSSDDRSKGLDIQAYLTPHNAPIFPQKK